MLEYQGYVINSADLDHILFYHKAQPYHLTLHTTSISKEEVHAADQENLTKNIFVGHIFYKDGNIGWRELDDTQKAKPSIRSYSKEQRDNMIFLTGAERIVVNTFGPGLNHFQPYGQGLAECVLLTQLKPVTMSYDYLKEGQRGFGIAETRVSEKIVKPEVLEEIFGAAEIRPGKKNHRRFVLKQGVYQPRMFDSDFQPL